MIPGDGVAMLHLAVQDGQGYALGKGLALAFAKEVPALVTGAPIEDIHPILIVAHGRPPLGPPSGPLPG